MQAGHLISRRKKSVMFDEDNVHCQCRNHNGRHRFYPFYMERAVIAKIGMERFMALCRRAERLKGLKTSDYLAIIEKYS